MRIFVGTLYSGENELSGCIESVCKQTYEDHVQFFFEGLPKKEAHDEENKTFAESDFDILVHLGADTVLTDNYFFNGLVKNFTNNDWLQQITVPLWDFFSNQVIWGINAYHNIEWEERDERVFTDFMPIRKGCEVKIYHIVGIHCPNPGWFQSFHYGAHKAMKILEADRRGYKARKEYFQDIINKTNIHYKKNNDVRLLLCVMGARFGIAKDLKSEHLDYTNPYLREQFDHIIGRDDELHRKRQSL